MNLLGKILTVLILLSSFAFLFMAIMIGSSHQNWKKMALDNKKAAEEQAQLRREVLASTMQNLEQLREEQVERAYKVAQMVALYREALVDQQASEASLAKADELAAQLANQITVAERRVAEQDRDISTLRDANTQLVQTISEVRTEVVDLVNQINVLEGTNSTLEQRQAQLAALNAKLTKVTRAYGLDENSLTSQEPPRVGGQVKETNDGIKFSVALGLDDGLREAHRLKVFRGDQYIGDADVLRVRNNEIIARMIENLQQKPVQKGDNVYTVSTTDL